MESVTVFGDAVQLTGIRNQPSLPRRQAGLLVINSGIVHRIGANRQSVDLCRRLAADGYPSLRFDLSGLGDSPARIDQMSWERSAPAEIVMAVSYFLGHGVSKVVLFGNCGGAAKGFWAAEQDPRVSGLIFTNPPPHPAEHAKPADGTAARLARLLGRGLPALFIFAAGDPGLRFYHDVLGHALARYEAAGTLEIVVIDRTNHTFATAPAKRALLETVSSWMRSNFPSHMD